ncbi:putative inactive purple acid phosphatase 16 isoform X2 [Fagus crenata]
MWFLKWRELREAGFTEQRRPPTLDSGRITGRCTADPHCLAVFVGHNHGLDLCCPYQKLWRCFARHTGYGGYGNWPGGARIIEITQQHFSIKSWIIMENNVVHSSVILSP